MPIWRWRGWPLHVVAAAVVAGAIWAGLAWKSGGESVRAQAPPPGEAGDPESGREIWLQDCAVCHGPRGEGSFRGPAIDDDGTAAINFMVRTGRMPIRDPAAETHRGEPAYDDGQIDDLVAYTEDFIEGPEAVEAVDVSEADVAEGGELYRLHCGSCHHAVGSGGALGYGTTAPDLGESTAVDTVEAVRFGPGNMPVFGPEDLHDRELREIAAYVEYLDDPRDRGGLPLWHLGPVPEGMVAWLFGLGTIFFLIRWLGSRSNTGAD